MATHSAGGSSFTSAPSDSVGQRLRGRPPSPLTPAKFLVACTVVLLAAVTTPGHIASASAPRVASSPPAVRGVLERPRSVSLRQAAAASKSAGARSLPPRPFLTHRGQAAKGVVHVAAPVLLPVGGAARPLSRAASSPNLLTAFPAASLSSDIAAFGSGQAVAPPDTQVAVGPNHVVAPVNAVISVWSKTGIPLAAADLNVFYTVPSGYFVSDPKVAYDAATDRWFLSGVAFDNANNSIVYLAISQTADPTGLYYIYTVATSTGVLQDQPDLGFDSDVVVLAWTDYSGSPPSFSGQETVVLQKSDLLTGAAVSTTSFGPDLTRFGIQPVLSLATAHTEELVYNNSCGPDTSGACNTGTSALGVVAITGTPAAGDVAWTETDPVIVPTSIPPNADQPGATTSISTDDDRLLSATSAGGVLYVSSNDACVPSGDSVPRPCPRLIEVALASPPAITLDVDLAFRGGDLYYPAVVPDTNGNVFMATTFSSTSVYPAATALTVANGASSFSAFAVQAGSGVNTDVRWGDYSGVAVDPLDPNDIWVAGEYAAASGLDWGTAIGELTLSPRVACASTSIPLVGAYRAATNPVVGLAGVNTGSTCVMGGGAVGLQAPASWLTVPFYGNVATRPGDVTGDGASDLVAVNSGSTWVVASNGTGFNAPTLWSSTPFYGSVATLLADANSDGKADLIAVNNASTWVMLSTGTGFMPPALWSSTAFYGSRATVAADVSGDGSADLVAVDDAGTWVMRSDGTGRFNAPELWSTSPFYGNRATVVADVNHDGHADLVAANDSSVWVMTSAGTAFNPPALWSTGLFYGSRVTVAGDLNGDGSADVIAVNGGSVWALLSNGSTAFDAPVPWARSSV
jgi:hypothetical protein